MALNNQPQSEDLLDMYELPRINYKTHRYPFCIVWTPIPLISWLFPMVGHMGICMSNGIIRDFAGSYYVSEDKMAFGNPARFLRLHPKHTSRGNNQAGSEDISRHVHIWDENVSLASVLYGTRQHNLCCDNCHSHVANALNGMYYKQRNNWNMFILAFWVFFCGHYVGIGGFLKTWLPFILIIITTCLAVTFVP